MKKTAYAVGAALLTTMLAACSGPSPSKNTLGIDTFKITQAENDLHIAGIDANGAVVAELSLSRGHVTIPEEGLDGDGRKLSVRVLDYQVEHQSVGQDPVVLPLMGNKNLSAFLLDAHVAPVMAKSGITFNTGTPVPEGAATADQPYVACTHDTNPSCAATSCSEDYGHTYENVCCAGVMQMIHRSCNNDSSSACGTNGPLGCAVCWSVVYSSSCTAGYKAPDVTYTVDGVCHCGDNSCLIGNYYCDEFSYPGLCICVPDGP